MPNTKSAEKALRQSKKKRKHNLFWKKRIKTESTALKKMLQDGENDILEMKKQESKVQKVVDKAAKNKVIHKNKAKRLKSRIAKVMSAHERNIQSKSKSS